MLQVVALCKVVPLAGPAQGRDRRSCHTPMSRSEGPGQRCRYGAVHRDWGQCTIGARRRQHSGIIIYEVQSSDDSQADRPVTVKLAAASG